MSGTVFSGDPLSTTLGNTLRVISYICYNTEHLKKSVRVAGDDVLVIIDKEDLQ